MAAGIARDRLILDPGMGLFVGSKPQVSLMILRRLGLIKSAFGLPLLVSVSRKSFLRTLVGRELKDIGPATLAAELHAALQRRGHDPHARTAAASGRVNDLVPYCRSGMRKSAENRGCWRQGPMLDLTIRTADASKACTAGAR